MADERELDRRRMSTARMEALSDGVFAIALTLLVLEISVPAHSGHDLLHAFLHQWPSYLAYVVSFATIGGGWLAHNVITEYLEEADARLIRLNLVFLMVTSFLPYPTRLLAEYIRQDKAERVAATIYGLVLLAAAVLLSALWRYAVRRQLIHPSADEADVRLMTRRLSPSLVAYVVLLVVGLFVPLAAVIGYLLIALSLLLPTGRGASRRDAAAAPGGDGDR